MESYHFEPPDFEMCLVCGTCREAGVKRCENCELRLKELEKQLKPEEVAGGGSDDFWFWFPDPTDTTGKSGR